MVLAWITSDARQGPLYAVWQQPRMWSKTIPVLRSKVTPVIGTSHSEVTPVILSKITHVFPGHPLSKITLVIKAKIDDSV